MAITVVAMSLGLGLVLVGYPLPFLVTFLISFVLGLLILTLGVVYFISVKPAATQNPVKLGGTCDFVFPKKS